MVSQSLLLLTALAAFGAARPSGACLQGNCLDITESKGELSAKISAASVGSVPRNLRRGDKKCKKGKKPSGHGGYETSTGHAGYETSTGHAGYETSTGHAGYETSTGHAGYETSTGHAGYETSTGNDGYATPTGHDAYETSTGHVSSSYTSTVDASSGYPTSEAASTTSYPTTEVNDSWSAVYYTSSEATTATTTVTTTITTITTTTSEAATPTPTECAQDLPEACNSLLTATVADTGAAARLCLGALTDVLSGLGLPTFGLDTCIAVNVVLSSPADIFSCLTKDLPCTNETGTSTTTVTATATATPTETTTTESAPTTTTTGGSGTVPTPFPTTLITSSIPVGTSSPNPGCINELPGVCSSLVSVDGLMLPTSISVCLTEITTLLQGNILQNAISCLSLTELNIDATGLDITSCLESKVVCAAY